MIFAMLTSIVFISYADKHDTGKSRFHESETTYPLTVSCTACQTEIVEENDSLLRKRLTRIVLLLNVLRHNGRCMHHAHAWRQSTLGRDQYPTRTQ